MKPKIKINLITAASVLVMGLGQLLNGQITKGLLYGVFYILSLCYVIPYCCFYIEDLISLGTKPGMHNSLFMMVYGIIAIMVLFWLLLVYISNIRDARRNARIKSEGATLPKFPEAVRLFVHRRVAWFFIAPGVIAVLFVVVLPLVYNIFIGFTDYDMFHQPPGKLLSWVGFDNFKNIFTIESWTYTLIHILGWTVAWTLLSSFIPYAVGVITAIVVNQKGIKGKRFMRTIFILPYAIPGYIMILVLRTMFDGNYGVINQFLGMFGIEKIQWLYEVGPARVALVIVAIWSGFTFPFMLSDSILKSISPDLYEAAKLDGASSFTSFRKITLPLLTFSIAPMFIMGFAGAFNNFNLIYLFNSGGPVNLAYQGAGSTDILISWLFKMTFTMAKYNYASAISLIIFIFIAAFSIVNLRRTKNYQEEDMVQ